MPATGSRADANDGTVVIRMVQHLRSRPPALAAALAVSIHALLMCVLLAMYLLGGPDGGPHGPPLAVALGVLLNSPSFLLLSALARAGNPDAQLPGALWIALAWLCGAAQWALLSYGGTWTALRLWRWISRRDPASRCQTCGYIMVPTHYPGDVCPECGSILRERPSLYERFRGATSWRSCVFLAALASEAFLPRLDRNELGMSGGATLGIAYLAWLAAWGAVAFWLWRDSRRYDRVLALPLAIAGAGGGVMLVIGLTRSW